MSRPELPHRKSSASENDESHAKKGAHRKTFHVGGATRNHTRVPSYGKKLNQLGKLTALTSNGQMPAAGDSVQQGSPHAPGLTRSVSQKSLSTRRNHSAQELKRARHGGSSTNVLAHHTSKDVRPTKSPHRQSTRSPSSRPVQAIDNASKSIVKPKFSISGDDDDEDDDDVEEESNPAGQPAGTDKQELEPVPCDTVRDPIHVSGVKAQSHSPAPNETTRSVPETATGHRSTADEHTAPRKDAAHTSSQPRDFPNRLLSHAKPELAVPKLTTETVVSKDIHRVTDSLSNGSPCITGSSQPLTSRFLESPRRQMDSPRLSELHTNGSFKANEPLPSPGLLKSNAVSGVPAAHHGTSAALGSGTSRTQQKLLLQRASSIYNLDGYEGDKPNSDGGRIVHPKTSKEIERVIKEYGNVCRYRSPMKELSARVIGQIDGRMSRQSATNHRSASVLQLQQNENRPPKSSHSQGDLSRNVSNVPSRNQIPTGVVDDLLRVLWTPLDGESANS